MEEIEYIEAYFSGALSGEDAQIFDQRISEDKDFAEAVAFYLAAGQAIREEARTEKKAEFRRLYEQYVSGSVPAQRPLRHRYALITGIAASVAAVAIGLFFLLRPASPSQLADGYIRDHFSTLGVTMTDKEDSLQKGIRLYNDGRISEALTQFETIYHTDPSKYQAAEYAGIVSLRMQEYDKALEYFRALAADTGLYANPGRFYEAITLLKRSRPGDIETAKRILLEVVRKELTGKDDAARLLRNL
jgi:tetratricopeptide (TPR) repeat protein